MGCDVVGDVVGDGVGGGDGGGCGGGAAVNLGTPSAGGGSSWGPAS